MTAARALDRPATSGVAMAQDSLGVSIRGASLSSGAYKALDAGRDLPAPHGRIDLLLHPEDTIIVPADDLPAAERAGPSQG